MATDDSADFLLEEGDLVAGKYRVDGLIGEGGMGAVLRATHVDLQRTVAIKIVRQDLAARDELLERLLLEARAVAHLTSEHVARVLDVGRLASTAPYIVMEYLEGADLGFVLLDHGALPVPLAVDFVVQACEAIAEAHAHGIIHRDLKPENLFLTHRVDGAPIIKVLDFGISKHLHDDGRRVALTNPSAGVGSPNYMAPEQMRAATNVDVRADIWSLGAILFELVTGRTPFAAETLPGVCALVLGQDPPPLRTLNPDIPDGLEEIVMRCLRKEREERYADVAGLAEALAPFGSEGTRLYAERVHAVVEQRGSQSLLVHSTTGIPFPPRRSLAPSTMVLRPDPKRLAISALSGRVAKAKPRRTRVLVLLCLGIVCAGAGALWSVSRAPLSRQDVISASGTEDVKRSERAQIPLVLPERVAVPMTKTARQLSVVPAAPASASVPRAQPKRRTVRAASSSTVSAHPRSTASDSPPSASRGVPKIATPRKNAWDQKNFGGRR